MDTTHSTSAHSLLWKTAETLHRHWLLIVAVIFLFLALLPREASGLA